MGLVLNYKIYDLLVTSKWGDAWRFPGVETAVILIIMILAAVSVRGPSKRIHEMSIVDTISAL